MADVILVPHPDTGTAELVLRNDGNAPIVFTIGLDAHYPTSGSRRSRHWPDAHDGVANQVHTVAAGFLNSH